MARGALSESERHCLEAGAASQERAGEPPAPAERPGGLRVRFLDEEGKTERLVSTDEVDCSAVRVKKIHFQKNRSSSEASLLLRHNSLSKRQRQRRLSDTDNNNSAISENRNGKPTLLKLSELPDKTEPDTKDTHYKRNSNVYSVNQAKTLTAEKRKSLPLTMPRLLRDKSQAQSQSQLPADVCLADAAFGKELTARALGRLSRGLGRLLRRTNSVRISDPDPVYKVAYLGNVLTGWARGESCIEKPLATLWRNYQQSSKPDVVMKLSVTNSGLKGFTKEHGLTEYWSHRITYCASPPHYPRLFCWVYRHEGKKLKHELRCHAVLCTKENVSKKITEELQVKLKQALVEFKKDRISKQNARLSLANSVYDNPTMPRRKILLSVGALNYRPPLERSKSAPKLGAIEELCSEEDEEEAEMNTGKERCHSAGEEFSTQTLDRRRCDATSRMISCSNGILARSRSNSDGGVSEELLKLLANESKLRQEETNETSQSETGQFHRLESIDESIESNDNSAEKNLLLSLVTDSDDGSVSSGCETGSTVTSDTEPTSLPSHFPPEELHAKLEEENASAFERIQSFENTNDTTKSYANSIHIMDAGDITSTAEVNDVPIGEKNFMRRSTYPPFRTDTIMANFDSKFESLLDNLADFDSLNSEGEVFKNGGDNESACSDESGYSELLDGKESAIGSTIMV